MRIVAIVQARNGSMRLPNKVMRLIQGRMMINILLDRLARSRRIDEIVVATTDHRRDDSLAAVVEELAQHGGSVNVRKTTTSETALYIACSKGHLEVVKALLKSGVHTDDK